MDKAFEITKTYNTVRGSSEKLTPKALGEYLQSVTTCTDEDVQNVWSILDPNGKGYINQTEFSTIYDTFLSCINALKNSIPRSSSLKTLQQMNKVGQIKDQLEEEGEKRLLDQLQEKTRQLELAAAREQTLKDQLNAKTQQLQNLKEELLKSKETGVPFDIPDSPKAVRSPLEVRDFHSKVTNLEKIEREISEKSKTLTLLNKQLFRRSGSFTSLSASGEMGSENAEGMQSASSFPEDQSSYLSSSPSSSFSSFLSKSPAGSPPRSPSPAFRSNPITGEKSGSNMLTDAVYSELVEVRALRDKLQGQLVKRREDNEALQLQLINAQSELSKKTNEVNEMETKMKAERANMQDLLAKAKEELDIKNKEMRKRQEELQGAQMKLSGPITTRFEELQVQLYNAQTANVDLQLQVDQLHSQLGASQNSVQSLEEKVMLLENAKSDLERKSILVVADSKQYSTQLEESKKHHESEIDIMHSELQKVIQELAEEKKGRKRAEKLQQEAEDEVSTFREARKRAKSTSDSTDDDDPFALLLQKARDKNAALEDSVSSLQAQVLKLQHESQSLRNEITSVRNENEHKTPRTPNGTASPKPTPKSSHHSTSATPILSARQRREMMTDAEARILEVEMRLKRQLSLTELSNLAKMAETELINSKLNAKIGELESALRSSTEACANAEAERARTEAKMEDSDKIIKQMNTKMHDLEDRLHDAKRGIIGHESEAELERQQEINARKEQRVKELEELIKKKEEESKTKLVSLESKVQSLEDMLKASKSNEDKLLKERQSIEQKIEEIQAEYEKAETDRRAEFEEQKKSLTQEANLLRERIDLEKKNYEEYSNRMDTMLEDEKQAKQSIIANFTSQLQTELKAAEENLTYTQQQLIDRATAYEEEQSKLSSKDNELESTKAELDETRDRVEELLSAIELAKSEFETNQLNFDNHINEIQTLLDKEKERSNNLQQSNDQKDLLLARLDKVEQELLDKTAESLHLATQVEELATTKTELSNLQAEIDAKQSILESKQGTIDSLEEDLRSKTAEYAEIQKSKSEVSTKCGELEAELTVATQSIKDLNNSKQEFERLLELEKKTVADLKTENSLLVSHVESKQGDLGDMVAQVGKLTEELHAQEKIASEVAAELKREASARIDAENQTKKVVEKLAALEASSSHMNSDFTQQVAHLHAESEHKAKTISSLETNLEAVSSHLAQTRAQLDELTKASADKSETISQLKSHVSQLNLEIEKGKVGLESISSQVKDKSETIAMLQQELEKRKKEQEAELKHKKEAISDLERRCTEVHSDLESLKAENKQLQSTIAEKEAKIFELSSTIEAEIRNAGETNTEVAKLHLRITEIGSELDKERMERTRVEEKFKLVVNSLIIIIDDIYKRLQCELVGDTDATEQRTDFSAYWEKPPQRDVIKDMGDRKAKIDEIIKNIATTRAERKLEMDSKLSDVTHLLEAEKLARTKVEGEKSALEQQEEARWLQLQQIGDQLANCNSEEGLPILVSYLEGSVAAKGSSSNTLTDAIRNILHESQDRNNNLSNMRVELASKTTALNDRTIELGHATKDLDSKTAELALKIAELELRDKDIESKAKEIAAKDTELESKANVLESKSKELESKNKELQTKEKELESKDKDLESKDKELESKDKELEFKNKELQTKDSDLTSKVMELESKNKELESKDKELESKTKELELKDSDLASKVMELESKNYELVAKTAELVSSKEELHSKTLELASKEKERVDSLGSAQAILESEKVKLESEKKQLEADFCSTRDKLEAEKKQLETDFNTARGKLNKIQEERKQLLGILGVAAVDDHTQVIKEVTSIKQKLESDLKVKEEVRQRVEKEASRLRMETEKLRLDLEAEKSARNNALEQLAADTRNMSPQRPVLMPSMSPMRMSANSMQSKRTMAMGGFGLGQVLKTFMTEHAAIPEDLEIVEDKHSTTASAIMGRTRSNSTVSATSGRSRSSSVSGIGDIIANLADFADVE